MGSAERCRSPYGIEMDSGNLILTFSFVSIIIIIIICVDACSFHANGPFLPPLLCSLDISSLSSCSELKNIFAMSMCVERAMSGFM